MASFKKRTTKTKGQVWDVVFRVYRGDKSIQKKLSGFPTKREAERAYEEYLTNRPDPSSEEAPETSSEIVPPVSFREAYNEYIAFKKNTVTATSLYAYEIAFDKYILPRFGTKYLEYITRADVVRWQDDIWNMKSKNNLTPLTQTTCEDIRMIFVIFMNWAVDRYSLESNPFDGLAKPRRRELKKERQIWSEKDFETFIENVTDINYRVYFTILFYSGCRRNEVNALTAEDFAKTADGYYKIKISKSVAWVRGQGMVETPPKTLSSNRIVSLPDNLTPMLDIFLEGKTGYLWNLYGQYIDTVFKTALDKTDLPRIRLHDLRHSHASILIAAGIPVTTVSKRLGHSASSTTLNVYSHAIDAVESDVLDVLENLWKIVSAGWVRSVET